VFLFSISYRFEYTPLGTVTEFRYGDYLARAFRGNDGLLWLDSFGEGWNLLPTGDALVFIDNHDSQRDHALTYKEPRAYGMASAFGLAWPYGISRVMSSFDFQSREQGPPSDAGGNILSPSLNPDNSCGNGWVCEHRWREISNMIGFKNLVTGSPVQNWWANGLYQIAFSRGNIGFIAFNTDSSDLNATIQTGLAGGNYCDIISGERVGASCSGIMVSVDAGGFASINVPATGDRGVLAIHNDVSYYQLNLCFMIYT
jgi:alpha-amylase